MNFIDDINKLSNKFPEQMNWLRKIKNFPAIKSTPTQPTEKFNNKHFQKYSYSEYLTLTAPFFIKQYREYLAEKYSLEAEKEIQDKMEKATQEKDDIKEKFAPKLAKLREARDAEKDEKKRQAIKNELTALLGDKEEETSTAERNIMTIKNKLVASINGISLLNKLKNCREIETVTANAGSEVATQIRSLAKKQWETDEGYIKGDLLNYLIDYFSNMAMFTDKVGTFYPTPTRVVKEMMLPDADIQAGMSILEPSAGKGNILDCIYEQYGDSVKLEAVELNNINRNILNLKGYKLVGTDFLTFDKSNKYDRIIMNPPFDENLDVKHITHATDYLKPNGKIIFICSKRAYTGNAIESVSFKNLVDSTGSILYFDNQVYKTIEAERQANVNIIIGEIYEERIRELKEAEKLTYLNLDEVEELLATGKKTQLINFTNWEIFDVVKLSAEDKADGNLTWRMITIKSADDRLYTYKVTRRTDTGEIIKPIQDNNLPNYFKLYTGNENEYFDLHTGRRTYFRRNWATAVAKNLSREREQWRKPDFVDARPNATTRAESNRLDGRFNEFLKPHQVDGVNLALESLEKTKGFLLADGTGAGKTIQQLAVAQYYLKKYPQKSVVIVSMNDKILTQAFKGDADKIYQGTGIDLRNLAIVDNKFFDKLMKTKIERLRDDDDESDSIKGLYNSNFIEKGKIYLLKYTDFDCIKWNQTTEFIEYVEAIRDTEIAKAAMAQLISEIREDKRLTKEEKEEEILKIEQKFKNRVEFSRVMKLKDQFDNAKDDFYTELGKQVSCLILDECHNIKNWGENELTLGFVKPRGGKVRSIEAIASAMEKGRRATNVVECVKNINARLFCSATPCDRPSGLIYLQYAGLFASQEDFLTEMRNVGFTFLEPRVNDKGELISNMRIVWSGKADDIAMKHVSNLFNKMTRNGKMIKREIELCNTTVETVKITMPEARIVEKYIRQRYSDMLDAKDKNTDDSKAEYASKVVCLNMEILRAIEPYKIPLAVEIARKNLDAGKSVIIYANLISEGEESKIMTGEPKAGSVQTLYDVFSRDIGADAVGIIIGAGNKFRYANAKVRKIVTAEQIDTFINEFQKNKRKVIIATPQAASTGLSLDDADQYGTDRNGKQVLISKGGEHERCMIILTPPMNAEGNVQIIGRITRTNTKSLSTVFYILDPLINTDAWINKIVMQKMVMLNAVVGGQTNKMRMKEFDKNGNEIIRNEIVDEDAGEEMIALMGSEEDEEVDIYNINEVKMIDKHTYYYRKVIDGKGGDKTVVSCGIYAEHKENPVKSKYESYTDEFVIYTGSSETTKQLYYNNSFLEDYNAILAPANRYQGLCIVLRLDEKRSGKAQIAVLWNCICNLFRPENKGYFFGEKEIFQVGDEIYIASPFRDTFEGRVISNKTAEGQKVTGRIVRVWKLPFDAKKGIYYYSYDIETKNYGLIKEVGTYCIGKKFNANDEGNKTLPLELLEGIEGEASVGKPFTVEYNDYNNNTTTMQFKDMCLIITRVNDKFNDFIIQIIITNIDGTQQERKEQWRKPSNIDKIYNFVERTACGLARQYTDYTWAFTGKIEKIARELLQQIIDNYKQQFTSNLSDKMGNKDNLLAQIDRLKNKFPEQMAWVKKHLFHAKKKSQQYVFLGKKCNIQTPSMDFTGRYAVVPLDYLETSNLPFSYAPNPAYPAKCQTRDYSLNKNEQLKIQQIVARFDGDHLLNSSPDATTGTPIVNTDFVVLGGNGRTMALKELRKKRPDVFRKYQTDMRVYADAIYKIPTENEAYERLNSNFDGVLIRLVDIPLQQCSTVSNALNNSNMQRYDSIQEGIAFAKQIEESRYAQLISDLLLNSDAESLADIMQDTTIRKELIAMLKNIGIINDTNYKLYLDERGVKFTDAGLLMVENTLLAMVLPDKKIIEAMSKTDRDKIIKALSGLIAMKSMPDEWNLLPSLEKVFTMLPAIRQNNLKPDEYFAMIPLFENRISNRDKLLLKIFVNLGVNRFKWAIKAYIDIYNSNSDNMFGYSTTSLEALENIYNKGE